MANRLARPPMPSSCRSPARGSALRCRLTDVSPGASLELALWSRNLLDE
jgi:hypothetical protein